jgi:hypothetical protein
MTLFPDPRQVAVQLYGGFADLRGQAGVVVVACYHATELGLTLFGPSPMIVRQCDQICGICCFPVVLADKDFIERRIHKNIRTEVLTVVTPSYSHLVFIRFQISQNRKVSVSFLFRTTLGLAEPTKEGLIFVASLCLIEDTL